MTCAEDVIEELPAPVRAALTQLEQPEAGQRNLLVAASLTGSGQKITRCSVPTTLARLTTSWSELGSVPPTCWPRFLILDERICAATAGKTVQQNYVVGGCAAGGSGKRMQY